MAAEEVGKLIVVAATAVRVAAKLTVDWPLFWKRFRDHPTKAWNAALIDRVIAMNAGAWIAGDVDKVKANTAGLAEARRQADLMPFAKNDALYVDQRNHDLKVPYEAISREQAETIVGSVRMLLTKLDALGYPAPRGMLVQAAKDPAFRKRTAEQVQRFEAADGERKSRHGWPRRFVKLIVKRKSKGRS